MPLVVVCMCWTTSTKCTMLKDRDYDVTPRIILILSLILHQMHQGSAKVCEVDMVDEECDTDGDIWW